MISAKKPDDSSYSSFLTDFKFPNIHDSLLLKQGNDHFEILKTQVKDEKLKLSTSEVLILQENNVNKDLLESPSQNTSKYEISSPTHNRCESGRSSHSISNNNSDENVKLDIAMNSKVSLRK